MADISDETHLLHKFLDVPRGKDWGDFKKPVLVLDGLAQEWKSNAKFSAKRAYIIGVNDKSFDRVCCALSTDVVSFYEMRVTDISSLAKISGLRRLSINWNSKLADLSPLTFLSQLDALALIDTSKASDLSPVAALKKLRAFEFSGSPTLSSKNTAESLRPLGELKALEELRLKNLKVVNGGLQPLAACSSLKRLSVANTFPTEDYAFLAAKLPKVSCRHFAATVPVDGNAIGEGIDTMVVGKRKPFLSSSKDADRIHKYETQFEKLKAKYLE